jgi:XTP/dITP diphosphohydrolase
MKLFVATHNQHKIREISQILPDFEIVPDDPEGIEENAPDFAGNALIKVHAIAARHPGEWCMADDSGLEVRALGGAPGVHSARYAGEPCNTPANNALLLKNLEGKSDRRARFTCCCALVDPSGEEMVVHGHCPGRIAEKASGSEGFGYDPLFIPDGYDKSFADLSADEKNAISHRGRALEKVKAIVGDGSAVDGSRVEHVERVEVLDRINRIEKVEVLRLDML